MVFLTGPPLPRLFEQVEVEDVAALDLEAVGRDVVLDLTQLFHDLELGETALLACLTQRRALRRLPSVDGACGNLDPDFLVGVVSVPKYQKSMEARTACSISFIEGRPLSWARMRRRFSVCWPA
jgi:hypothetical protein